MRLFRRIGPRLAITAILALASLPCFASEIAVLRNGFSIRHERRKVVGNVTRLYVTADGSSYVDVPTAEIEHFEAAPDLPDSGPRPPASAYRPSFAPFAQIPESTAHPASPFAALASNRPLALNLDDVVSAASGRYRLDPDLVNSVIKAESGFNVRAVSPKGAQGLMQLMPQTASELGVRNVFDPQANVEGGAKYLRELLERYNFDLVKALAAYNAGPQRVEQFGGVPPFYETRAYVARVVKDFNKKKVAQRKAASESHKIEPGKGASSHRQNAPGTAHNSKSATQAKTASASK